MSALDLDAVRKRLNAGLRAALTDDCAQVLTADLRAFMAHEAGLRMRELLWTSSDAGWRELIAVLEADGKPEGAAVDYVRALITRLRAAEARTAWQPIASVPIGETVMLWTPVRRIHVGHVTTLAWCEYTAWAPLPAAPEAP
jgi:hypothetical protein